MPAALREYPHRLREFFQHPAPSNVVWWILITSVCSAVGSQLLDLVFDPIMIERSESAKAALVQPRIEYMVSWDIGPGSVMTETIAIRNVGRGASAPFSADIFLPTRPLTASVPIRMVSDSHVAPIQRIAERSIAIVETAELPSGKCVAVDIPYQTADLEAVVPLLQLNELDQPISVACTPSCAEPADRQQAYVTSSFVHTVQPGETLYRIALMYRTTVYDIALANNIVSQHYIHAYEKLLVPVKTVRLDEFCTG